MPTTNIVSAQNVTGNISSCSTEISIINSSSRPNLFIQEDTGWATNNCTGSTTVLHSWELTGFAQYTIGFVSVIIVIAVIALLNKMFD